MRKYLIAAIVLAAGCDSTRRDFTVCDTVYSQCLKGFVCDMTRGLCVPEGDGGPPASEAGPSDVPPPVDVTAAETLVADAKDAPIVDVATVDLPPVLDTPITDAPIGLDLPGVEARIPDAAGSCSVDSDCLGGSLPYCVNQKCVACKVSGQCSNAAGKPFCSALNTCVSCAAATGDGGICSGTAPTCDPGSGRCVECVQNSDCPTAGKGFCVANQCVGCNAPGASAGGRGGDAGASDGGGGNGSDGGVLPACTGATPVCANTGTVAGQCVQCVTSADCSGSTPVCNASNQCVPCTSDSQCTTGPGICMFHQDGRCASDAETIYVKNSASCTTGSGTATSPYCDSQLGINAVTTSKRVLVMIGPTALSAWQSTATGSQISVIGQAGAVVSPGASIGAHVSSGNVYVRGLTVQGGTVKAGIVVEAGATLALDRCIVKGNVGGGLIVQAGASFDVGNTVFDNNGPGVVNGIINFGGVFLGGSAPASGQHRLWFSTIVNNQDRGVICADATQALSGMLLYANVNGGYQNCVLDSTNSKWDSPGAGSDVADPAFSSANPYHLTTASHCRDFVPASLLHPVDDMDGDLRPYPATGKLDCGADEYHP